MSMDVSPPEGQNQPGSPYGWTPQAPQGQPHSQGSPYPYAQAQQPHPYTRQPSSYAEPADLSQGPYGQPQSAQPNPPTHWGQRPQPPVKRRRKGYLIAAAAVLATVGGALAYFVGTMNSQDGYKLVPPASFQGLAEDKSNAIVQRSASLSALTSGGATPLADGYVTAVGEKVPQIVVVGDYGKQTSASDSLQQFWTALTAVPNNVATQKTDESAGPLGGILQCAFDTAGSTRLTSGGTHLTTPVCAWADGSSVMGVFFYGQSAKSAPPALDLTTDASTTLALRAAMEVRK